MADTIVLLEEKKETTTFFLDESPYSEVQGSGPTGDTRITIGENRVEVDDIVSISDKSDIAQPVAKKYEDGEIVLGININEPTNNTTIGMRESGILILGQLFRLKIAEGQTSIDVKERMALSENGAVKDSDGEYITLHAVEDQADYEYVDVLRPFAIP